jgi:IS5 family transposase
MHIIQAPLFDFDSFIRKKCNDRLIVALSALPAERLLSALEREHRTGRKGSSVRGMWSALIAGVLSQADSLSGVIRLLERDKDTRLVCGFSIDNIPSHDAFGRFLKKLVKHGELIDECFNELVREARELLPGFGDKLAVDATDIKAYSSGHRKTPSDPDARWGAKGSGHHSGPSGKDKKPDLYYWFGYKLHLVVDALYELPVAFEVTPANESDSTHMEPLLKRAGADKDETRPVAVMADKGYDSGANNRFIFNECRAMPIIPIREVKGMQMPDICNAKGTPLCRCGLEMAYWGRDGKYLKYRCPDVVGKAQCQARFQCTASPYGYVLKLPIADDPRRHPPIPRESQKWGRLYRLRASVERVNSRLKEQLGLGHLTLRGLAKATLRSALSLLVMLAAAVGMARRNRLSELRLLVT